ncbi:site-specific recombination directionality factor RDF [Acinetobacter phage vB_AbaM_ME3]|uniref:Putative lipoprotein n=1 Tax=Acinetobacter phage vB_AbaM_ME3 TaxID=1837876 RepID=A0A172Q0N8_9CAUD|nr:site-specific recombination directionality factor RDF [Acinetobacter phage vB_AbaM_ME3]AND75414.1 putative lipoprotein [Acinetobacter phage vB_AbaM_ME3]
MKKLTLGLGIAMSALALTACGQNDAQTVSQNIATAADNFEIDRRIVFYNGITSDYILSIEGKCSFTPNENGRKVDVMCKTGPNEYKKHSLGLSDNVTYFSEQLNSANVSAYHYRVIFKPQSIIPDVDVKVDLTDVPKSQ